MTSENEIEHEHKTDDMVPEFQVHIISHSEGMTHKN